MSITLTELGQRAALNVQAHGPKADVLTALYESSGPMTTEELVDEVELEDDKMLMVLRALAKQGYIRNIPS